MLEVYEVPQGLLVEVKRADREGTVMIPFDERTVTEMDAETRTITIDPVEGLLD